jgi:hypothetical protein
VGVVGVVTVWTVCRPALAGATGPALVAGELGMWANYECERYLR